MNIQSSCRGVALSAALAWLLGSGATARGQVNVHVDLGRHPGASIHFGGRPAVRPVAPVVVPHPVARPPHYEPPALVRHEHYERHPGVWHSAYREEYLRRLRPGWVPIYVGEIQYYVYPVLPVGYQTVVVNGVTYYFFDGVYYLPYIYEGQTVFMAVPPPLPQ